MKNTQTNRETWLHLAKVELQKDIFTPAKLTIPSDVQISVGFMHGGRGKQKSVLGQKSMQTSLRVSSRCNMLAIKATNFFKNLHLDYHTLLFTTPS